ncbi:MAG: ATP-binding cassette domain-containing protein [Bacillota bacterium]
MNTLSIANLSMTYFYGAKAIDNLNLTVSSGECVAILGESESGKTSLVKCIAGLYPASEGNIYINNKDVTNLKIKDRDVLLLFDDCGIIGRKSVRFNLEYPLKLRKISRSFRRDKSEEVARECGIYPLLSDRGYLLGEEDKVRLAVARIKMRKSNVVLIDDIFKMVSSASRKNTFLAMLPHINNIETPVIFTTTSVDEAFTLSDKIVVMRYGIIEQIGTRKSLIEHPNTVYIDKFINPYRCRIDANVESNSTGSYVKILGKKVYKSLLKKYVGQNVIVSFIAKECETGRVYAVKDMLYNGGVCYAKLENDITLIAPIERRGYCVEAVEESVNIYDSCTERLVEAMDE